MKACSRRPWLLLFLALSALLPWFTQAAPPSRSDGGPPGSVRPITQHEARLFADVLVQVIETIARRYYQPVAPELLAGKALVALYEAAGVAVPVPLRGDLVAALAGTDLRREGFTARKALGDPGVLRGDRAYRVALNGMVEVLDPHTQFFMHDDRLAASAQTGSSAVGFILEDPTGPNDPVWIRSVILGSPASQAGILPGDELVAVDGDAVPPGLTNARLARVLSVAPGRACQVVVRPPGGTARTVLLTPSLFEEESLRGWRRLDEQSGWDYWLDRPRQIAYLRLGSISTRVGDQMGHLLNWLQEAGLSGVVLDLRDCPGGAVFGAVEVAGLFLPAEQPGWIVAQRTQVASASYRGESPENRVEHHWVLGGFHFTELPVSVLIGPTTTGGGELIAAALQDYGRAQLFGGRTRGKGTIQRSDVQIENAQVAMPFTMTLTAGLFFRASGQSLQRLPTHTEKDVWGVRPSPGCEIRLPPAEQRLQRRWRHLQDLRREDDRTQLPLDRLENDPVLHAAWRWLTQQRPDPAQH